MRQSYLELYEGGQGELTEKRSRFIATVRPVKSEEEAAAFIEETRKKYWDANHNCTAFSIGLTNPQVRCSDDGEPGGTAGRPMLDVLLGKKIHNVCVVVLVLMHTTFLAYHGLLITMMVNHSTVLRGICMVLIMVFRDLMVALVCIQRMRIGCMISCRWALWCRLLGQRQPRQCVLPNLLDTLVFS